MRGDNGEHLARRWPAVLAALESPAACGTQLEVVAGVPCPTLRVDGVQLAGGVAPAEEARLQARLVPADAGEATCYGIGQGALPRTLLARSPLARLRVVLTSLRGARATFAQHEHADWLADARVELCLPAQDEELALPFAVSPAELVLADGAGARLRDLLQLELATPFVSRRFAQRGEELEANLRANAALLERDADVSSLDGTATGGVVRVCAAGPTLADHFDELCAGEGLLIAVDAALGPLLAADIVPDVVVSIDSLPHGMRAVFDVPRARLGESTLVYFPAVPHEVVSAWPGRRLVALTEGAPYAELAARRPRAVLYSSGSVIHPAVDLAVRTGAGRVELFGADFATPRGKSHVDGAAWQKDVEDDHARPWVSDGHGTPIPSQANLIGYLRELERYVARVQGVDFVNASREGARILGARYPEEASHAA